MGGFSKLKELFVRAEPLLAPMDDPFIQIDTAATSERLRLRERGAEQGALDQPPTDMRTLDAVEAEIVAHVHEHYARAQSDAANSIRTYDGRMAELALLQSVSQIGVSARTAVSDFRSVVADALDRLANSGDAIARSYAELREFRGRHGIRRPAHRASTGLAGTGYVLLTWLGETLINSLLLRQNDAMGLVGGIFAAGTIGFINIGISALVGRLIWPLTQHRSAALKTLGWGSVAVWLAFIALWNWVAAHYRDAKVKGIEMPEAEALRLMYGGLDSINSWALFLAGFVFAVLAARSAFRMDDPYPGYGPVSRRHDERCDSYAYDVADSRQKLKVVRDDAIDGALGVRAELDRQHAERGQILAARSAFVRRFEEYSTQLEVITNALLQEYRTSNRAARTTPAPETFSSRWPLPRTTLPPPPEKVVSEKDVEAAEAALESATIEISAAFDRAIGEFEPLDVLKRRLENA